MRGPRVYRWRGGHPLVRDTFINRISRWSLRRIVFSYLLSMAALAALGALTMQRWGRQTPPYSTEFRNMAQELISPGSLLSQGGQAATYYTVVFLVSLIAYLSPIFLLSAFVFKLFVRDPIVWRRNFTIEDRIGCGAVLVFRFYNASRSTLTGLTIKIYAQVETSIGSTSILSRPMALITRGKERAESREWGFSPPHEPFSAFVPLSDPSHALVTSAQAAVSSTIDLQGMSAPKDLVTFVVRLEGTHTVTGSTFVSINTYKAADAVCGAFQSIDWEPGEDPRRRAAGWENFDGNFDLELFVYDDSDDRSHHGDDEDADVSRLEGDLIDLEPLLRDAVVLALPYQPLCREDCPGLCVECGARLADDPEHRHDAAVDPRWAALGNVVVADPSTTDSPED